MKGIAVFQHYPGEGPGYFARFAERAHLKLHLFQGHLGETLPASIAGYAGMVVLGGPMSVNDRLPFVEHEKALISEAIALDIPVIGHCLGGQLLAEALGGMVGANPGGAEIGWHPVRAADAANPWFGDATGTELMHWHSEYFTLPEGATLLLDSAHCPHQAFSHGIHLGMQFHLEMDEAMLAHWSECVDEIAPYAEHPGVQAVEAMLAHSERKLIASNALADRVYRTWARALKL